MLFHRPSMRSFCLYKRNGEKIHEEGFTLIEIMVGITVVGILSSVTTTELDKFRERARDTQRVSDIRQIALAMELGRDQVAGTYGTLSETMPVSLSTELPMVPANNPGNSAYEWISNTDTDDRFCVWAIIENSELGTYFVGNHLGSGYQDEAPTSHFECNFIVPSVSTNPATDDSPQELCHFPPGKKGNKRKTVLVDSEDIDGHLNNHTCDHIGACDDRDCSF